jgi:hypothetical protein
MRGVKASRSVAEMLDEVGTGKSEGGGRKNEIQSPIPNPQSLPASSPEEHFRARLAAAREAAWAAGLECRRLSAALKEAKAAEREALAQYDRIEAAGPERLPLFDSVPCSVAGGQKDAGFGDSGLGIGGLNSEIQSPVPNPQSLPASPLAWRGLAVQKLPGLSPSLAGRLAETGFDTIGALHDQLQRPRWFSAIRGFGEAKAARVADAFAEFWRENPEWADEAAKPECRSENAEGSTKDEGWRDCPVSEIPASRPNVWSLEQAGVDTLGKLRDRMEIGFRWWDDVPDLDEAGACNIAEALGEFLRLWPEWDTDAGGRKSEVGKTIPNPQSLPSSSPAPRPSPRLIRLTVSLCDGKTPIPGYEAGSIHEVLEDWDVDIDGVAIRGPGEDEEWGIGFEEFAWVE